MTHPKEIFAQHHLRPNKRLGQNFLINEKILARIAETADLSKQDTVLEIGAGLGGLTRELAERAGQVVALEKDAALIPILKGNLKIYGNVQVEKGDILKQPPDWWRQFKSYKVVANIPYYLTSHLIRCLLEAESQPEQLVLLVQKEVAQRICARPPRMNLLAVSVQFYGAPRVVFSVPKNFFWPRPKVDSAVVKIADIKKPPHTKEFFETVKAGFAAPRKQLVNNLSKKLGWDKKTAQRKLAQCGLPETARAENLSVEQWLDLSVDN